MSWIKENYEKAALGGAVLLLTGVCLKYFVFADESLSSKPKSVMVEESNASPFLPVLTKILEDRSKPAKVDDKIVNGRKINLLIGEKLYLKPASADPIDLHESPPVHDGIDNTWWLEYGIDPTVANAPERDFDKDGFTNREEYVAKTDPIDADNHPSLLNKLVADAVEVFKMRMRWNVIDDATLAVTYRDTKRSEFRENVGLGKKFFVKDNASVNQRFLMGDTLVEVESENDAMPQKGYKVTDLSPRYKGTDRETFVLLRNGPKANGFNEVQDLSVTLTLHALGKDSDSFTVDEYEKFSLPYDPKSTNKRYQVKEIKPSNGGRGVYSITIVDLEEPTAKPVVLLAEKK